MIFLLFLASIATIEVILRHDEGKKHQIKPRQIKPPAPTFSEYDATAPAASESVLALMNTLDRHGRGKAPAVDIEVAVSEHEHSRRA